MCLQVRKVIGESDFKRYTEGNPSAADSPVGVNSGQQQSQAADGLVDVDEDEEEDAGFFDALEPNEAAEYEEYEEQDESEEQINDNFNFFDTPGPFDDLFTGDGKLETQVLQQKQQARKKAKAKGKTPKS